MFHRWTVFSLQDLRENRLHSNRAKLSSESSLKKCITSCLGIRYFVVPCKKIL